MDINQGWGISGSTIGSTLGSGFGRIGPSDSKFLSKFGTGLSAAYFLADLGSKRGTVDGATNPVSRDRRDSDGGLRAFTAADVKSGTALSYVNNGTTGLYGEVMYFDGVNDEIELGSSIDFGTDNWEVAANITGEGTIFNSVGTKWVGLVSLTQISIREQATSTISTVAFNGSLNAGQGYRIILRRVGNVISADVDGVTQTATVTVSGASIYNVTGIGTRSAAGFFRGIIYNLNINNVATWDGTITGATSQGWTVAGSPAPYSGQPFNGLQSKFYDGLAGANDATQTTVADMPKSVVAGTPVVDGNGNASTLWDGTDELTFTTAFTGLTSANVYAVTDNAGTVTLNTITAFDISGITTMTALLTSLTYTKVTAVIIAPDNANQAAIQAELNSLFGI